MSAGRVAAERELEKLILESIRELKQKDRQEILDFIEFIKIRENRSFVEYVKRRTREAINARKRGERFTSLHELQQEYA